MKSALICEYCPFCITIHFMEQYEHPLIIPMSSGISQVRKIFSHSIVASSKEKFKDAINANTCRDTHAHVHNIFKYKTERKKKKKKRKKGITHILRNFGKCDHTFACI
ncbi:hypothetical protein POVWA2_028140 [Plasmodium ovale wallikeri]|uniref:Uncharacterized protein n=1 Tax=Plasmodium ovale wallikeri TaxID=864142 RepID=A0A1A8YWS5_PLAOA|nr:hypothetical protein POVWA1_028280 [Plasmodium ovale wallikeri]SBT36058.1 hypothetical protein POVWA2_028140 [Plasmodium ovale wallikeri]